MRVLRLGMDRWSRKWILLNNEISFALVYNRGEFLLLPRVRYTRSFVRWTRTPVCLRAMDTSLLMARLLSMDTYRVFPKSRSHLFTFSS